MREIPERRDQISIFGGAPAFDDAREPQPVNWWAASNAAAVSVQVLDFATGYAAIVALPADGSPRRLFPQGMAVREPVLLNLSTSAFEFGFRPELGYADGRGAIRVPADFGWTKYGLFAGSSGATILSSASYTRPADTNVYAAGDAVADSTSAPTALVFAGCGRLASHGGVILEATLLDYADQATKAQLELYLFSAAPTPNNDNAALALSAADLANLVAVIAFTAPSFVTNAAAGASGNVAFVSPQVNAGFVCGTSTSLWGLLVVRNAYTPVSGEQFTVKLKVLQD